MFTPLFTKSSAYTQLSGKKSDVVLMMEKYGANLLQVDVDRLFEEHHIKDIVMVKKMFDAEIERKRIELRTMVSDKYKDILTASDAIAAMKDMSQRVLDGVQEIHDGCVTFIDTVRQDDAAEMKEDNPESIEERTIVMQIRLTMAVNERIWLGLDEDDFSSAAQFYLLGQHMHTGLRLLKKDVLEKVPLLKRVKVNLESLRARILNGVKENLKMSELSADRTSSDLTALMLLENQSSSELVNTFIEIRKDALRNVTTQMHSSVRHRLSAMVKCLTTTVRLLHDCFVAYMGTKNGLIWKQLEDIVNENAPPTLSKMKLPHTPLIVYIPDIIKQFRPKCSYVISEGWQNDLDETIKDWLRFTSETVAEDLGEALELVTSVKGLHIIREEALKIPVPDDWETICTRINLPSHFNVWYYFFQESITRRAINLITQRVVHDERFLRVEVAAVLDSAGTAEKSESDLRWYGWGEDADDVSKTENTHIGLSMKTRGYSPNIIRLCEKVDTKYLDILKDISFYLHGKEYTGSLFALNFSLKTSKTERKFADRDKLEHHLTQECSKYAKRFTEYLVNYLNNSKSSHFVLKSLMCARFMQALMVLCPNYRRCVCQGAAEEWERICDCFANATLAFWTNWVDDVTKQTEEYSSQLFGDVNLITGALYSYQKWDTIEIQEQTEEGTFKSHIKVPHRPSSALQESLDRLSECLSRVLPHTLPRPVHLRFLERNVSILLSQYEQLLDGREPLTQKQALQFLFDVKFLTAFSVPRENMKLVRRSQEICDKLRGHVDPFDLDVFYSYLQNNVKQCALQSQVILGCLLPNNGQLSNLGMIEKNREHEKEPSILPVSLPSSALWFPLLPVTAPTQKTTTAAALHQRDQKSSPKAARPAKRVSDTANTMRSGAAALFGAMTTDWFSNK